MKYYKRYQSESISREKTHFWCTLYTTNTRSLRSLRPRAVPFVLPRRQTAHGPYATYHNVGRKLGYGYTARWNRMSTPVRSHSQMFELICWTIPRICPPLCPLLYFLKILKFCSNQRSILEIISIYNRPIVFHNVIIFI